MLRTENLRESSVLASRQAETTCMNPPSKPPEYREITIVLRPALGLSVAMNAVVQLPRAVKHRITPMACGSVSLKYCCPRTPLRDSQFCRRTRAKTSTHIGTVVSTALTCTHEVITQFTKRQSKRTHREPHQHRVHRTLRYPLLLRNPLNPPRLDASREKFPEPDSDRKSVV